MEETSRDFRRGSNVVPLHTEGFAMPPRDKVVNQWDPPPPTTTVYMAGAALALFAAVAVGLGYCELGAGLAGLSTVLGLVHIAGVTRMDIPQPPSPRPQPVDGSGGWPPDPPPPTLLKSLAFKSAATAFAASGAVVALTDCCETALIPLGLSVVTAAIGMGIGRPRTTTTATTARR